MPFAGRSIVLDPDFSKAYQWLVYVYVQDGIHYRTSPIEEARGVAEELAMKATELDPNDGGAYAALGFVAQMSNDLPAGLSPGVLVKCARRPACAACRCRAIAKIPAPPSAEFPQ